MRISFVLIAALGNFARTSPAIEQSFLSTSKPTTFFTLFANSRVSSPKPLPISITVSSSCKSAAFKMASIAEKSIRKCCPNFFFGLKRYFLSRVFVSSSRDQSCRIFDCLLHTGRIRLSLPGNIECRAVVRRSADNR